MQNNRINALSQHHLVIPDCDDIGNLKVAYVFVQYVGVEIEEEIDHLLICRSCNKEAESLQQILMQGTVESIFLEQQKQKYCIHSRTLTKFSPESYFKITENSFPWYFGSDLVDIEHLSEKPVLAAVLSGGQYGLVSLPPRAKKLRCIYPHKESKVCCHVKTYEENEGNIENQPGFVENKERNYQFLDDMPDLDINGDIKGSDSAKECGGCTNKSQKLKWPLDKETQLKFKQFAREGYQYESLTELIPEYDSTKVCKHGNKFSPGCPKKKFWIQSRNVKIYNTEYLAEKPRTAYFRPTENNLCSCKDYWNGDDHLLLKVSKTKLDVEYKLYQSILIL